MINKKLMSIVLAGVLSTSFVGCSNSNSDSNEISNDSKSAILEEVETEVKVFQPYEHVFFERHYNTRDVYAEVLSGGWLDVPEGYEIIDIENFSEELGYSSQTAGYDVWYTNTVEVEAISVYNIYTQTNEFSAPGKVINQEDVKTYQK